MRDLADDAAIAAVLDEQLDAQPTIVTLSDPGSETGRALLLAGARGVIRRDVSRADLESAIDAVAHGFIVLTPGLPALPEPRPGEPDTPVLEAPASGAPTSGAPTSGAPTSGAPTSGAPTSGAPTLTKRERDVLNMLAAGLSNKRIAARLSLAENTVKFHVASILSKLDATTRTQAVTIGVRRGWVML